MLMLMETMEVNMITYRDDIKEIDQEHTLSLKEFVIKNVTGVMFNI